MLPCPGGRAAAAATAAGLLPLPLLPLPLLLLLLLLLLGCQVKTVWKYSTKRLSSSRLCSSSLPLSLQAQGSSGSRAGRSAVRCAGSSKGGEHRHRMPAARAMPHTACHVRAAA